VCGWIPGNILPIKSAHAKVVIHQVCVNSRLLARNHTRAPAHISVHCCRAWLQNKIKFPGCCSTLETHQAVGGMVAMRAVCYCLTGWQLECCVNISGHDLVQHNCLHGGGYSVRGRPANKWVDVRVATTNCTSLQRHTRHTYHWGGVQVP
jgi:hypothetical protein